MRNLGNDFKKRTQKTIPFFFLFYIWWVYNNPSPKKRTVILPEERIAIILKWIQAMRTNRSHHRLSEKHCRKSLCQWKRCTRISLKFDILTFWREPQNHIDDCYLCFINIACLNKKKRTSVNYPSLNLPMRPIPDSGEIQIVVFKVFTSREIEESDHANANNFVDTGDNDNWNDFERLSSGY